MPISLIWVLGCSAESRENILASSNVCVSRPHSWSSAVPGSPCSDPQGCVLTSGLSHCDCQQFKAEGRRLPGSRRAASAPRGKRVLLAVFQPELGVMVQNSPDLNPLGKLKELKSTLVKHYILLGLAGPVVL